MTREEAIEYGTGWLKDECLDAKDREFINMAVEVLEQEPYGDCISRQAVLDLIENYNSDGLGSVFYGYEEGVKFAGAVNKLTSVNPQRTGHEDAISRKSIKQKLQEHHDFFVNAYGGFSNLPQNDKSRVDEITNCIAMVVNEPPVTPQIKTGHCEDCKYFHKLPYHADTLGKCFQHTGFYSKGDWYCADFDPQESEE